MDPLEFGAGREPVVDRCVCRDVTFATLVRLRREEGLSLDALRERTGCCATCRMCEPYVRVALCSGRTVLPVLTAPEADAAMRLDV